MTVSMCWTAYLDSDVSVHQYLGNTACKTVPAPHSLTFFVFTVNPLKMASHRTFQATRAAMPMMVPCTFCRATFGQSDDSLLSSYCTPSTTASPKAHRTILATHITGTHPFTLW